jgi:hypothetical protein
LAHKFDFTLQFLFDVGFAKVELPSEVITGVRERYLDLHMFVLIVVPYGPTGHNQTMSWISNSVVDVLLQTSLHGSCPVVKGEKWVATKWIRDQKVKMD